MRKTYEVTRFKSDGPKGRFTALVAIFENVDLVGDRIVKGAFANDLERWQLSGDPIPCVFSHDWGTLDAHIGSFDPLLARETSEGLELTGAIDLDDPPSAKVFRLLQERRVKEFSFAYDVVRERRASDGANELLELRIIEAGPCLKGANPETRLLDVKAAFATRRHHPDLEADLLSKGYDRDLVLHVFGKSAQQEADARREVQRRKAVAAFEAANRDLRLAGTIPGEADRAARLANEVAREESERAARERESADLAARAAAAREAEGERILDETPRAFGGRQ